VTESTGGNLAESGVEVFL